MNRSDNPSGIGRGVGGQRDDGFTLIEILIAIVLVGILSAVAVVGISNLVSKGSTSACQASADAAKAASAVYFASNAVYPTTFMQMVSGGQLAFPGSVTVNTALSTAPGPVNTPIGQEAAVGTSWYLTLTPGVGGAAPTFVCSS